MNTNVNLAAPIGALALLGTAFILVVAAVVLVQSLIMRKRVRARLVVAAILLIGGGYLAAMLIFSIASHDKVLARGEEKHFCEIDCHLAYSIINTLQTKRIGEAPKPTRPHRLFTVFTIRTPFDET